MTEHQVVKLDRGRAALTGIELPDPPPTRVYISGRLYRIAPSPQVPLPPLLNTVKVILNWVGVAGRTAKNIFYLKCSTPVVTSDPTTLKAIANMVMNNLGSSSPTSSIAIDTQLVSATVKDNAGTTAQATSDHAPITGGVSASSIAPQVSVAISWQIAESYRGGKPRWYLFGIPANAVNPPQSSTILNTYAATLESRATAFMTAINGDTITSGGSFTLGTVSYHTGHVVRPTPLFRTFIGAAVHERLDSQRRRSGKESSFGVIP